MVFRSTGLSFIFNTVSNIFLYKLAVKTLSLLRPVNVDIWPLTAARGPRKYFNGLPLPFFDVEAQHTQEATISGIGPAESVW